MVTVCIGSSVWSLYRELCMVTVCIGSSVWSLFV